MNWLEHLTNEAKKIILHGDGELSFIARPNGTSEVKVIIKAGESHSFIVKKED